MNIETNWQNIRRLFAQAFRTSFHYSMATVTPDGLPHVTPVGSLMLTTPGRAIYFEEFTRRMPLNFRDNQHVCVLAVRTGAIFWLRSLVRGGFRTPPAIRLHGTVGAPRAASADELHRWQRRVRRLAFTRGHRMMWANMRTVRDVHISRADGIYMGEMTRECWNNFGPRDAAAS